MMTTALLSFEVPLSDRQRKKGAPEDAPEQIGATLMDQHVENTPEVLATYEVFSPDDVIAVLAEAGIKTLS